MSSGPGGPPGGFPGGGLPPGLDAEAVRRLAEEMERMPVQRVLQETVQLLGTLGEARILGAHRDLDQARLAIDSLKALAPVLSPTLEPKVAAALGGSIANLQLAYVKALAEAAPAPAAPGPGDPARAEPAGPGPGGSLPAEPAAGGSAPEA